MRKIRKFHEDLMVSDLKKGQKVITTVSVGTVEAGEEGVVVGFPNDWQVEIKFKKAGNKKFGDNGTRFLKVK